MVKKEIAGLCLLWLATLALAIMAAFWLPEALFPSYEVHADAASPKQGQTMIILIRGVPAWLTPSCRLDKADIPVYRAGPGCWRALIPVAGDARGSKSLVVAIRGFKSWTWERAIQIEKVRFRSQKIRISKKKTALFQDPEVPDAGRKMRAATEAENPEQLWRGRFQKPVEAAVTGPFGNRRVLGKKIRYFHKGADLAAPKGARVRAANRGRVTLAGRYPLQGNVVVLDHGQGVQTAYMHLDAILVQEGQWADKGQPIGTVGATGIATGPHLHWGVYVHGVPVNPQDWLRRTF
ncbi:MAG: M23 family metallopeptidase [Elusimicrobiota bacterium]